MNQSSRCLQCVMPEVTGHVDFDEGGVCSMCRRLAENTHRSPDPEPGGIEALREAVACIKRDYPCSGDYDCIAAVSGGKDSTMALHIVKKQLRLSPLAVFVDNGFCSDTMYRNVISATDILDVDLIIIKPRLIKALFKYLLPLKKPIYYCRVCNALIDRYLRETAARHGVTLLVGGYTKGQDFLKGRELFWIYRTSDEQLCEATAGLADFREVHEMFQSLSLYFHKTFNDVCLVSPFQYVDYNEREILETISRDLNFQLPSDSWPAGSTNCLFNVVSQFLAVSFFGYSQHEVEISMLVRNGEMTRQRALEIVNTPMPQEHINMVLGRLGLVSHQIL